MSAIRYTEQLRANVVSVKNDILLGGNIHYDDGSLLYLDTVGNIIGNIDDINTVGNIGNIGSVDTILNVNNIQNIENATQHTDSIGNIIATEAIIGDVQTITYMNSDSTNIAGNIGNITDMSGIIANLHGGVDSIGNVPGNIENIDGNVNTIYNHGVINGISGSVSTIRDGSIDEVSGDVSTIGTNANIGVISSTIAEVRGIDQLDEVSGTIDTITGTINSVGTIDSIMTVDSFPGSLTANTVDTISTLVSADIEQADTISSIDTINTLGNITTAESVANVSYADHIETITHVEGNVDAGTVDTLHNMSNGSIDHVESMGHIAHADHVETITHVEGTVEANTVGVVTTMSNGNVEHVGSIGTVTHADRIESITDANIENYSGNINAESGVYINQPMEPGYPLAVTGDAQITGNLVVTDEIYMSGNSLSNIMANMEADVQHAIDITDNISIDGTTSVLSTNLDVDGSGTFLTRLAVGSNVVPPADIPLHVTTSHGGYPLVTFENTYPSATDGSIGLVLKNTEQTFQIGAYKQQGLQFRGNGATRMVLSTNGNLGLGTADPEARLDVNGTTKLRSEVYVGSDITNPDSTALVHLQNNGSRARLTIDNTGNTNAVLSLRCFDDDVLKNNHVLSSGPAGLNIYDLKNSRTSIYIANDDNNVGISTTSPTAKLDVNGNIRLRDAVQIDNLTEGQLFLGSDNIVTNTPPPGSGPVKFDTWIGYHGVMLTDYVGPGPDYEPYNEYLPPARVRWLNNKYYGYVQHAKYVSDYDENGNHESVKSGLRETLNKTGFTVSTRPDVQTYSNVYNINIVNDNHTTFYPNVTMKSDLDVEGMTTLGRYTSSSIDVSLLPTGMTQTWFTTPQFNTGSTLNDAMTFVNMNVTGITMVIQLEITFVQNSSNNMVGWTNVHIRKSGTGQPGMISEGRFYADPANPSLNDMYQPSPLDSITASTSGSNVVLNINIRRPSNHINTTAVGFVKASIMKWS